MSTTPEEYGYYFPAGVTVNNNTGVNLTFGNVANDLMSAQTPAVLPGDKNVHSPSANKAFSGGTLDRDGNYLFFAHNVTVINGLTNTGFQTPGLKEAARVHGTTQGRAVKIESVDYNTGEVTYVSGLDYQSFNYYSTSGGPLTADAALEAQEQPYSVPPRLVVLGGQEPTVYSYSVVGG